MKKVTLYIAQSLDGFVATSDGSVAWLDPFNNPTDGDYGYSEFTKNIDAVIQGKTTYDQFKDGHKGKNSYVFAHDADTLEAEGVTFVKGSPKEFIENLDDNHQNIWLVGGPNLLAQFLDEQQIDEMIIFTMPVLLGNGISLFSARDIDKEVSLSTAGSKTYENGVIESVYKVK